MTLEEVCKKYEVSESGMKTNFPRTQQMILKKHHIKIIKQGRGAFAFYIEQYELDDDKRAITMYDEKNKNVMVEDDSMSLMNWDFMIFLAIVTTPMMAFRGSYEDMLKYCDMKVNEKNIQNVKISLQNLVDKGYILFTSDNTNNDYFLTGINRRTEVDMKIGINMIRECHFIAAKNRKQSWVPLLKVWLGVQMLSENQPFTMADLQEITGLSAYQVKSNIKLLRQSDIFKTSKAYNIYKDVESGEVAFQCLGTNVELNGFYEPE